MGRLFSLCPKNPRQDKEKARTQAALFREPKGEEVSDVILALFELVLIVGLAFTIIFYAIVAVVYGIWLVVDLFIG